MSYAAGGPVFNWEDVTPDDSDYLRTADNPCQYLRVGTAGNVTVTQYGGNDITFDNVLAGEYIPVKAIRVKNSLTTASNILAAFK